MLSVIIPTLNAELNLADCLERMKEADEIIVVDGGSTDETISVAEQFGARFLSAPRGRGAQLRDGGAAARGDWLLFLHADTLPDPAWPAAVAAHVENHPNKSAPARATNGASTIAPSIGIAANLTSKAAP